MTMATIGTFTTTENGFTGSIRTLALNVKARIARVENPSDKGLTSASTRAMSSWVQPGRSAPSKLTATIFRSSSTIRASRLRYTQRSPRSRRGRLPADLVPPEPGLNKDRQRPRPTGGASVPIGNRIDHSVAIL
ncbi:conserved hypothetical protein (plasmid) [Allorhizobium ampelinum S4]|uniref:DUF736 family protein n=1 Tax=Allorhizobium ampelinum (strain ATCC BAA-846 / DSM 112012 / S4) TaxID=311402 RepID=B9K363_ALLAM|nr:conserved hypothetical protein [Allorhizobium ampelinum S4]